MSEHVEHAHHITPISVYVKTFLALVILMALTVASNYVHINSWVNNGINLGIASIKATLVITFFMGVKYTSTLTKMFALAGFIWLTLMTITFGDYMTRGWEPAQGWYSKDKNNMAAPTETMQPQTATPTAKKADGAEE